MKAVVLVGGEGTRLRPVTLTTPKPLLPIANQAFLERQLRWLARHGVDEVVLSLGYRADAFEKHFPDGRFDDVRLHYKVEDEPLGTAGAIKFAADGIDERFVVWNGDVLTALDLTAMVAFHDARRAEATISLYEVEDPSAFGVVPTRDDGRVIAFVEKPPADRAPTKWINAGTYILEPGFLDRIPARLNVSVERETFPRMLESDGALFGYKSDTYWLDIGTPQKYLDAQADVLAGHVGLPPTAEAKEHAPGVWVQGHPVFDGAAVEGPALLGDGSVLAPGSIVAQSVIGPAVHVGRDCRIERSVLLADARLGDGVVVTDAVVGPSASVGAGAVLSDLTLIGADAHVAAGARLSGARVASNPMGESTSSGGI
ncbi:MAG: Nucleoside-diphosphate-sugar pyrophosphorylase family protein [Actinomycetia bacterium]|nr:Nucleoside-diphosphate-sugar pyrophosphorylase family protein [Actinomycetes bacterium]